MQTNKRIIRVLVIVSLMFLSLVTYLLYFNMFRAEEISSNTYNKRQWEDEKFVKRGSIYDRDGEVLAETIVDGDNRIRKYPKGKLYSHIIGYYSKVYGKSLLEMSYDRELLGHGDINISFNELRSGYDLNLTIDHTLQSYAYDQLAGRDGAVVAIEPSTGKILAMVSYPDFDPSTESLEKNWKYIVEREDSPLLARATGGLYAPGSTYKIVTAATAYSAGYSGRTFTDDGVFEVDDLEVENYGGEVLGDLTLKTAFEKSSNDVFCTLGYELGAENVKNAAESFGINKDIPSDIPMAKSRIEYKKMTNSDAALVSIGQGQLLMTPLHVAMMGATVANDGKMMKPYLVNSITTASGISLGETKPEMIYQPLSTMAADYLDELMIGVAKNGTGRSAQISGITVAGKTGTAENETDKD
ncbi:MAG: penicillin-binding transpeptidase domain-containing protein, partial [Clostridia bacterium]|nr:penicillin-binding transpeptidase domain-containing protein [Clostridia bacterium]